jgi:EAL domain-containing protein (putative c-di-GMP-specific phosphodiesterase class I)/PAS domain-containing protein
MQSEDQSQNGQIDRPGAGTRRVLSFWTGLRAFAVKIVPALATIVIGMLLLFTIYVTLLDWQWIIFLSGVLFAALIALASRASHAEWTIRRRTVQLSQIRERLAQETAAHRNSESAYHLTADKLELLSNALPLMLVYVDAGAHVRALNSAFRIWLGKRTTQVDGLPLAEVIGAELYSQIEGDVAKALEGQLNTFERKRFIDAGAGAQLQLVYLPHADAQGGIVGLYIMASEPRDELGSAGIVGNAGEQPSLHPASAPAVAVPGPAVTDGSMALDEGGTQTLYLRSVSEQLTGWDNPEQRLRQALENDEFRLFCQQYRDLRAFDGDCPYFEILIRLQEEESNLTPPGAFIPVAEEFNMTTDLDRWVVRNVIAWHGRKRQRTPHWRSAMYSLNLFSSSMLDRNFTADVGRLLDESGVPPEVLCFEIAEDEAARHIDIAARFVSELHRFGCHVALGGFGSGRVSFDILKRLHVHFLKIDGGIVRDIQQNAVNRAKIEAIGRVCSVIGVKSIAQFVEDAESLKVLAECGIDYAQGFGVARPHSIELLG